MRKILLVGLLLSSLNLMANESSLSCKDSNSYAVRTLNQVGRLGDTQAIEICKEISYAARLLKKNEMDQFKQIILKAKSDGARGVRTTAGSIVMQTKMLLSYALSEQEQK